jgi:uncharacterized protein YybS (DUF2232 family)
MVDSGFGLKNFPVPPGYTLLLSGLFFMAPLSPSLFGWLIGLLAAPVFCLLSVNGYDAGRKQIFFSLVLAGLGALLVQQLSIFLFSLTLIPLAFTLFKSAQAKESAAMSGGKGLVALGLTWFLFWGAYGVIAGINPYAHLLKVLDLGFQQTLELYSAKEAGLDPEMVVNLNQATTLVREIIPQLLPGLLASLVTITVWMNMVLVNYFTGRLTGEAPWGSYTTWKLPEQLVWLPIAAIMVVLFGKGFLQDAGSWLLALAALLYFFQGMAVFIVLLERWRVPLFVRIILYFILIVQSYGLILLAILGLSDVWLNIRKKPEQQ